MYLSASDGPLYLIATLSKQTIKIIIITSKINAAKTASLRRGIDATSKVIKKVQATIS